MIAERLKALRKEKNGLTQEAIAKQLGIAKTTYSSYEQGKRQPDYDMLTHLANYFDVSTDYLLGKSDKKHYYDLTPKDRREVETTIQGMISGMDSDQTFSFFKDGPELSNEDKQLLIASLRQTLTLSKELAKKKFTPKKYRKDVTPRDRENDGNQ